MRRSSLFIGLICLVALVVGPMAGVPVSAGAKTAPGVHVTHVRAATP